MFVFSLFVSRCLVSSAECRLSGWSACRVLAVLCVLFVWCAPAPLVLAHLCPICATPSKLPAACTAAQPDPQAVYNSKCTAVCGDLTFRLGNDFSAQFTRLTCIDGAIIVQGLRTPRGMQFPVLTNVGAVHVSDSYKAALIFGVTLWVDQDINFQDSSGGMSFRKDVRVGTSISFLRSTGQVTLQVFNNIYTQNGGITFKDLSHFYLDLAVGDIQGPLDMQNCLMDFFGADSFTFYSPLSMQNVTGNLWNSPPAFSMGGPFSLKNTNLWDEWNVEFIYGAAVVYVENDVKMTSMTATLDDSDRAFDSKIILKHIPSLSYVTYYADQAGFIYLLDVPRLRVISCPQTTVIRNLTLHQLGGSVELKLPQVTRINSANLQIGQFSLTAPVLTLVDELIMAARTLGSFGGVSTVNSLFIRDELDLLSSAPNTVPVPVPFDCNASLPALTSLANLTIQDPLCSILLGCPALTSLLQLSAQAAAGLTKVASFAALRTIQSLALTGVPRLSAVSGFSRLENIGSLVVQDAPVLLEWSGSPQLTAVGNVSIAGVCPCSSSALSGLSGLSRLEAARLNLRQNSACSSTAPPPVSSPGRAVLSSSAKLRSSPDSQSWLYAVLGDAVRAIDKLEIELDDQVTVLPSLNQLRVVNGSMSIRGRALWSLSPLCQLTAVAGPVIIDGAPDLCVSAVRAVLAARMPPNAVLTVLCNGLACKQTTCPDNRATCN